MFFRTVHPFSNTNRNRLIICFIFILDQETRDLGVVLLI